MKNLAAALAAFATGFVLTVAGLSAFAFLVMILVGNWHHATGTVPPLSFLDSLYVTAVAGVLGAVSRTSSTR
ncbi:hypothetical protein TG1_24 [Streptomyces phage TG1]|uniref:Uncharacterized protein n=1 Tax=Streptomyces phage TG1 TaxID=2927987 RepID=K4IBN4_9CAUD|nr:hypothetical protein D281_gp24 [Streptomyces phage TG1]AFU62219.1 hypothetical protein TG1_24 [Streptomyces phage TG1]